MDSAASFKDYRDLIIKNIDELLLKLTEHGEESLLMTADGTSLHVTGSEKGKKFLAVNRQIAEQFHKFCFDVQEKVSECKIQEKSPPSFLRYPIAPKTAITVTSIKEVDSDFEVDQEETEETLKSKDSSFTVFNIENQEHQSRKLTASLLDTSSPGKPKQERLKNIRVQIQRGSRRTEIILPEKSDLTVESNQASVKSRLLAPDQTQTGQAANSQTITDHQQSSLNDEIQNLSSDSKKSVTSKPESEARNIGCESEEVSRNTSLQNDSNEHGTGTNETSSDAVGDHTFNDDHSEPMDSVDTFVHSPVEDSDSETHDNNPSVSQGNKPKFTGDSPHEPSSLGSNANYRSKVKDIHSTADGIKDCQETAITDDGDPAQVLCGNQAPPKDSNNTGFDMEVDISNEKGTKVDQNSPLKPSVVSPRKKGKEKIDTEKGQKKRKISRSPQRSPAKKIRGNPDKETGSSPMETASRTTEEDETLASAKITSAKERSEVTSSRERSEVTSVKERSEVTSVKERSEVTSVKERWSEVTSAKETSEVTSEKERSKVTTVKERSEVNSPKEHLKKHLKVSSEEKNSKKNSTEETSQITPSEKSSDVALAKETFMVTVRSPENSASKSSEKVKIKHQSTSPPKSIKSKQKLQVKLPIRSCKEGDTARLFKKSLVVQLEKIPDTTIQLLGKSPKKAASEFMNKSVAEKTEIPASELKQSPLKGSSIQTSESKELTLKSKAKPPSESKNPVAEKIERPVSELKKSPLKESSIQTLESKELTPKSKAKPPSESKNPVAEKIERPSSELKKSPLKESSIQTLESKELTPESITKSPPKLKKAIAEKPSSALEKSPLKGSSIQTSESKELTLKNKTKPLSESEKSIERSALKSKKPVSDVCDKPRSKSQKSPHRIKDLSNSESNRPKTRIAEIPATETKESRSNLSDTLAPKSKKSTPNGNLASESKMSTSKVIDINASESKLSTPEITDKHVVESTLPTLTLENKATNSKEKKDTGDKSVQKSIQKYPDKVIIKQPVCSDIAGKGKCDLKNFKIDLKALAMELALQRQKKP
ncbi:microtubule-associated protein futsch-like [Saccostrea echinata]|uniref:microtubule-associated protein futsch-like n=1 Tax=Saccostrea echinata TaxID=191078 RepID=UPI002A82D019|nr:microtubule-associated protein futsch-like [Saccostrea echinata]